MPEPIYTVSKTCLKSTNAHKIISFSKQLNKMIGLSYRSKFSVFDGSSL